ncbi:MAG: hypothetical protein L0H63_10010, partial [Nitrococcus sp.]|nr:hypothetical protein [Nitrococcus sp.]
MALVSVTPPTSEPITVELARLHAKIETLDDYALMDLYIGAARAYAEGFVERSLASQTWRYTLDCFLPVIRVPMPPLIAVTSLEYVDTSGITQTLAS